MKPGVYSGIPNAQYHGGEGVSNSGLTLVRRSPLTYRAKQVVANDSPPTLAQAIGTAFHALLLEPQEFFKDYCLGLRQSEFPDAIDGSDKLVALIEELNRGRLPKLSTTGTKEELAVRFWEALTPEGQTDTVREGLATCTGKALKEYIEEMNKHRQGMLSVSGTIPMLAQRLRDAGMPITLWSDIKAEWLRNNGHRNVLDAEEWDQLMRMRDAVMHHPAASKILGLRGKSEQSVYWIDPVTGELCRCRPDWWAIEAGIILDVKTTEDASPDGFRRSIEKYGYDVQDSFYTDGILAATGKPLKAFMFLAVEKDACVIDGIAKGVEVYQLTTASRDLARAIYRKDLATYAECKRTGYWPSYSDGRVQVLEVSSWRFTQNAHLLEKAA